MRSEQIDIQNLEKNLYFIIFYRGLIDIFTQLFYSEIE